MSRRIVILNSTWLIADKIIRLGLGLIVWLWLARHFGPEAFGVWNFALAFAAIFAIVSNLGLDGVVQRELAREPTNPDSLIGTALSLRVMSGTVAALACVLAMTILRGADSLAVGLVAMSAAIMPLQSTQVIEYYFQARMRPKAAVLAANLAFSLATLVRLLMLWLDAALIWFGVTLVLEAILSAAFLVVAYRLDGRPPYRWRVDPQMSRQLLRQSWPLLLSGIAVMVYMRIDQLMLGTLMGDAAVGQFSAALRISEVWYFIPAAIVTAAFPVMMNKRMENTETYERYVQRLYDAMAWMGIVIATFISLIAPWLIEHLYGPAYKEAVPVLTVQIWAGVAVAMSFVHGRWLLAEGLQRLGLVYTLTGALVNILLNMLLVPRLGPLGAAWATLATQVGLLPLQLAFPRARKNCTMMFGAVLAPFRLPRYLR